MASEVSERFAVYFTLAQQDPLYQKAAKWLGHCIYGAQLDTEAATFRSSVQRIRAVKQAAQYGFHATLKPPFRLKTGSTQSELSNRVAELASSIKPFSCAPLKVASLGSFVALTPSEECEALSHMACQCVEAFEPFRASLNERELNKRLSSPLTHRQKMLLEQWGYPYVFDEFRFHMTLTDRLEQSDIEDAVRELEHEFAPLMTNPLRVEQISLCHQKTCGAPFYLLQSYPLAG